jgi:membrane-associated phospholipid phosphatase
MLLVGYGLVFVLFLGRYGLPTDTVGVMVWLLGALTIAAWSMPGRRVGQVLLDWVPFMVVLVAYDYSRGLATKVGMPIHVQLPVDLDKAIGLGQVPTIRLQHLLGVRPNRIQWWETIPTIVYVTHFLASPIVAAVLWVRDRDLWLGYIKRYVTLVAAGFVTYVLVPWSPPWLAAKDGLIPDVTRSTGHGWDYLHLSIASHLLTVGQAGVNLNAAMPSLHASFAMLIAVYLWPRAKRAGRVLLGTYAVAMAFSLVLMGEHWVNDIIAGWIYVAVIQLAWNAAEARRAQRSNGSGTSRSQRSRQSSQR